MRQDALDPVHHLDGVRTRLALDRQHDGAFAVEPARVELVFDAVHRFGDVLNANRRAVLVGDDLLVERRGVLKLPARMHDDGLAITVQRSGRDVRICGVGDVRHLVDADSARGQRHRIGLDAHREFLRAIDVDLRHAVQRGDLPRQQRFGVFVHFLQGQGGRAHRQIHDRRIRRIHFAHRRRRRHVLRQMVTGSRDRGLNILRRAVDIAVEIELDGDLRRALRARRAHRADAGDGGELVFQRRRHA